MEWSIASVNMRNEATAIQFPYADHISNSEYSLVVKMERIRQHTTPLAEVTTLTSGGSIHQHNNRDHLT